MALTVPMSISVQPDNVLSMSLEPEGAVMNVFFQLALKIPVADFVTAALAYAEPPKVPSTAPTGAVGSLERSTLVKEVVLPRVPPPPAPPRVPVPADPGTVSFRGPPSAAPGAPQAATNASVFETAQAAKLYRGGADPWAEQAQQSWPGASTDSRMQQLPALKSAAQAALSRKEDLQKVEVKKQEATEAQGEVSSSPPAGLEVPEDPQVDELPDDSDSEIQIQQQKQCQTQPTLTTEEKMELHRMRKCVPCYFHHGREDGCRWGEDCHFCHYDSRPEWLSRMRYLKRERRKQRTREGLGRPPKSTDPEVILGLSSATPEPALQ